MSSAATCRHAWACHCQPFGRDTSLRQIPAEDDVPAVWIVYMVTEREVKPSTAKAYTSGLRAIRVQLGCVCVPVRQSWAVHAAQQGCERRWDTPSKQLMPTEFAELLRMAEQVNPDSFNYTVVFTATDLAFFAFFGKDNVSVEKAEAWSPRGHLIMSDVIFPDDSSADIRVRHSKSIKATR
ncbi:hypothetical protein CYMTET_3656 [Cymbomonas tetramitiformis]|uniref:Uncharacterized protein n=1 Tax=Cymbomonas tetramitiformis TaxID=36881 RepID=A0AAE0H2W8_9CHLO|nr:hypothetical protein CYMTET_3656 [Cymbomonas tetramitiformis]